MTHIPFGNSEERARFPRTAYGIARMKAMEHCGDMREEFKSSATHHRGPRSDTTILGFVCGDGKYVVKAADRRVTVGDEKYDENYCKIENLGTGGTLMAICGYLHMATCGARLFRVLSNIYWKENGQELNAEGRVRLIADLVEQLNWGEAGFFIPIVGLWDAEQHMPRIAHVFPGNYAWKQFYADGSGGPAAHQHLLRLRNRLNDLPWYTAANVAAEAIYWAAQTVTSANFRPTIAFVHDKGSEFLSKRQIDKIRDRILKKYGERSGTEGLL